LASKQFEGGELPLDELQPGSFCGEMSMLTATPTTALVRATENSVLIQLDQESFHRLLELCPVVARSMVRTMAERVRQAESITWQKEREALLKIEYDVQTAKRIQLGFLPTSLPQLEGWHIISRFHPAMEVAGDFYDSFPMIQGRRLGLVMADVCDKGVGSALFMALSRSLLRAYAEQNQMLMRNMMDRLDDTKARPGGRRGSASAMLAKLSVGTSELLHAIQATNDYIVANHAEMNMFVTIFFGMLDPATGKLFYINAGHESPYIIGADGIKERLKPTGPAVGLFPDVAFELGEAQLAPGDILFTFTDGVPDARNPTGERFGKERLNALLNQPALSAEELLGQLEQLLQAHRANAPQFDDITMLIVQRGSQ
jgi:sigma-B regulation protein RsbU (phosphoserine phosphatase)